MPSFLKSLFKPSHSPPRARYPAEPSSSYEVPSPERRLSSLPPEDLHTLADQLRTELRSNASEKGSSIDRDTVSTLLSSLRSGKNHSRTGSERSMRRLMRVLEEIEAEDQKEKEDERITIESNKAKGSISSVALNQAYHDDNDSSIHIGESDRAQNRLRKGKFKAHSTRYTDPMTQDGKLLKPVIKICSTAIRSGEKLVNSDLGQGSNFHLLGRIMALLEAQKDELVDIAPYTGRRRYPALITLEQIYEKVQSGLRDIQGMSEEKMRDDMMNVVEVLQEGPDYLIDIILITSIIHQASIISIPFSNEIRSILDKAIDEQGDLNTFRKAGESIIAIASALDRDLLEDKESEEAYKRIGVLVKQLQVRGSTSALPTPYGSRQGSFSLSSTPTPLTIPGTPLDSPGGSVSSSGSLHSPRYASMTPSDLQKNYGTGVSTPTSGGLPGVSSFQPTPAVSAQRSALQSPSPASPTGSSDDDEEIWEYRGQLLTRSALDLVLRQEALAQADSSGQYAGDVSWDDLRNCWIPKYVKKLKITDLAKDELPDTSPAGFQLKDEDEWGNKIGWYGEFKEMYYKEDPKWELPDDD
ncbi:uncharacterized protein IL334_005216 [Kwoniella shivajii]|uniref:Rho-GAP domain-containing protein n=1 Tax=Kwoniella shivajii TaxID=564305 RepID=A0ABZ1D4B3_9TREE|nr:hypothetical protein IL334_005216 [Kwoniella shivajii]